MMPGLRRLTYASRISAGSGVTSAELIASILRVSVRNNAAVGVTGMLLSHRGYFVQTLEGPGSAVQHIYRKVAADGRHNAVRILSDDPVRHLAFANWAMCGRDVTPADNEILDVLAQREDFNPYAMSGRDAQRLLKLVHTIHVRAAEQARAKEAVEL